MKNYIYRNNLEYGDNFINKDCPDIEWVLLRQDKEVMCCRINLSIHRTSFEKVKFKYTDTIECILKSMISHSWWGKLCLSTTRSPLFCEDLSHIAVGDKVLLFNELHQLISVDNKISLLNTESSQVNPRFTNLSLIEMQDKLMGYSAEHITQSYRSQS